MAFDYGQYLILAKQQARSSQSVADAEREALERNATSRAYYATLHGAIKFIEEIDGQVVSDVGSSHENVWRMFQRQGRVRNAIYDKARQLKLWREWADYNDGKRPPPPDLKTVFVFVGNVQELLKEVCNGKREDPNKCWFLAIDTRFDES